MLWGRAEARGLGEDEAGDGCRAGETRAIEGDLAVGATAGEGCCGCKARVPELCLVGEASTGEGERTGPRGGFECGDTCEGRVGEFGWRGEFGFFEIGCAGELGLREVGCGASETGLAKRGDARKMAGGEVGAAVEAGLLKGCVFGRAAVAQGEGRG